MRSLHRRLVLPLLATGLLSGVGACGRGNRAADDALGRDLALAAQAAPYQQQVVSPTEQGYGYAPTAYNPYNPSNPSNPYGQPPAAPYGMPQRIQTVERGPVYAPARTSARRTSSSRRSSRGGGGAVYRRAPSEPVRNTKRDAAIGAAAGAVIGATTSRDKMKGGIIGAAAGAVLGGIIGHTVDVDRRP